MSNYDWANAHKKFGKYMVTVEVCEVEGTSRADLNRNDGASVNLETADNDIRFEVSPALYGQMTEWAYANGW